MAESEQWRDAAVERQFKHGREATMEHPLRAGEQPPGSERPEWSLYPFLPCDRNPESGRRQRYRLTLEDAVQRYELVD
jgi:hypothetical protein